MNVSQYFFQIFIHENFEVSAQLSVQHILVFAAPHKYISTLSNRTNDDYLPNWKASPASTQRLVALRQIQRLKVSVLHTQIGHSSIHIGSLHIKLKRDCKIPYFYGACNSQQRS